MILKISSKLDRIVNDALSRLYYNDFDEALALGHHAAEVEFGFSTLTPYTRSMLPTTRAREK